MYNQPQNAHSQQYFSKMKKLLFIFYHKKDDSYILFIMIAVLIALYTLLPYCEPSQCQAMCQCIGNQCQKCLHDFTQDAQFTYMPLGQCGCPIGYFMDNNKHFCKFCPIKCIDCQNQDICITCEREYINIEGECILKQGQIQFANDLNKQKFQNKNFQGFWLQNSVMTNDIGNYFDSHYCRQLNQNVFGSYYFDYNTYVVRTYHGLPPHQYIKIKLQFVIIDQWLSEKLLVQIQTTPNPNIKNISNQSNIYTKSFLYNETQKSGTNFCGNNYNDNLGFFNQSLSHTASILKLRVRPQISFSQIQQSPDSHQLNMYYGLKEILLLVGNCPEGCNICDGTYCGSNCKNLYTYDSNRYICICDTDIAILTESGKCIPKCGYRSIYNMQENKCQECQSIHQHCSECNTNSCVQCQLGYFLFEGSCEVSCPLGFQQYYNNTYYCASCPSQCSYCKRGFCQSCQQGYYLFRGQCLSQCVQNYFTNQVAKTCQRCQENCKTCNSPYNCTQCRYDIANTNFSLINGQCIQKCFNNFIPITQKRCQIDCSQICQECFGNQSNQCLSCNKPFVMQGYQCLQDCKVGFYESHGTCLKCDDACLDCSEISCFNCAIGYFLYQQECLIECPDGYYEQLTDNTCKICSENCSICYDQSICQSCKHSFYLYNGTCVSIQSCAMGKYYDYELKNCLSCPQMCNICHKDLCQECDDGSFLDNGKCVLECPYYKYQDLRTNLCLWKSPLCQNYSMTGKCEKCIYLNPPLILSQNNETCSYSCPQGYSKNYYDDNSENKCTLACQNFCEHCMSCDEMYGCLRCSEGYVLNGQQYMVCQQSCPKGYRSDGIRCLKCQPGCSRCQQNGQCLQCLSDQAQFNLTLNNFGKCVTYQCLKTMNITSSQQNCTECSPLCQTCTFNSDQCTSCYDGRYLMDGHCYQECPNQYYPDSVSQSCLPCLPQCHKCSSEYNCTQCIRGYYEFYGKCLSQCPQSYYLTLSKPYQGQCHKCNQKCQTCYGQSQYQCLSCHNGYHLDGKKCVLQCPIGKYQDPYGHCQKCSYLCKQCYGPASFQCSSCANGSYLLYGNCYKNCPLKTYANSHELKCLNCPLNCQNCKNETYCQECAKDYKMNNGKCLNHCPKGKYTQGNTCSSCNITNCQKCFRKGCKRCEQPYLRYNYTCVENCPLGTYEFDKNIKRCLNCPNRCLQCSDRKSCTLCKSNFKLSNGLCLKNCRRGYYYNQTQQECLQCSHPNTLKCNKDNIPLRCQSDYYLYNNTCVIDCPDKYFAYNSSRKCRQCNPTCKTCSNNRTFCESCEDGYQLINFQCLKQAEHQDCGLGCAICSDQNACAVCMANYYLTQSFQCTLTCQNGFYAHMRQCLPCDSKCLICQNKQICQACTTGYVLHRQSCFQQCPLGFYEGKLDLLHNLTIDYCWPCEQNCFACISHQECSICKNNFILHDGFCVNECPQRFYSAGGQCIQCDQNCLMCRGPDNCYKCSIQTVLFDNTCLDSCSPGTYLTQINKCKYCQQPCQTCINKQKCLSCIQGYILSESQCILHCPQNYFITNQTGKIRCQPCIPPCQSCSQNGYKCKTCRQGFYLLGNKCMKQCPLTTYQSNTSFKCQQCSQYCLKCQSALICYSCHSSTSLLQGLCVQQCPQGYRSSLLQLAFSQNQKAILNICQKCISPCLSCQNGNIYKCNSCVSGYYLQDSLCLSQCPYGSYPDQQNRICRFCSPQCSKCTNFYECTQCRFGYNQSTGLCITFDLCLFVGCDSCSDACKFCYYGVCYQCYTDYYIEQGSCVLNCSLGYYKNEIKKKCQQYSNQEHCLAGKTLSECSICQHNYSLYKGRCYLQCPDLTKINQTSEIMSCIIDPCVLKISQNCTSCMSPYISYQGKCIRQCQDNYFQSGSRCEPCPTACSTCTSITQCSVCKDDYILYKQLCYEECPVGWYNLSKICQPCSYKCKTCRDQFECTSCKSGYFLQDLTCKLECSYGFFANYQLRICQICPQNCVSCKNQTFCTLCTNGLGLIKGQCLSSYELGYFKYSTIQYINGDNLTISYFYPCQLGCANCLSSSQCLICYSDYFLYENNCVGYCVTGTYQFYDGFTKQCKNCSNICEQCQYQPTICTKCIQNYTLYENQCLLYCPDGYYSSDGRCYPCHTSCTLCYDFDTCRSCKSGLLLIGQECLANCTLMNQYYDHLNFICRSCSSQCYECYGPRYDQCLSCRYPLILYQSMCIDNCPQSHTFNSMSQLCIPCSVNCLNCSYQYELRCLQCDDQYFLYDEECHKTCPDTYFKDHNDKICKKCINQIWGCLKCKGDNIANKPTCLKCYDDMVFNSQGQCMNKSSCLPRKMVIKDDYCMNCPSHCEQCSLQFNEIVCDKCTEPFIITNQGLCQRQCLSKETQILELNIYNQTVLVCQHCEQNCRQCQFEYNYTSLNRVTNCLQCQQPFYLINQQDIQCVLQCPIGYLPQNQSIKSCIEASKQQIFLSQCLKLSKMAILETYQCVDYCPNTYYIDINSNNQEICKKCSWKCQKCYIQQQCLKCQNNYYLINESFCVSSCPSNHLIISDKCIKCQYPCQSCSQSLFSCTSCSQNYSLLDNQCLDKCPNGFYTDGKKCHRCQPQCQTCQSYDICLVCSNNYYNPPNCTDDDSQCSLGYYKKSSRPTSCSNCQAHCGKCHKTCQTCFGPNKFSCLSCLNSQVLVQGQCKAECPVSFVKNLNNKCIKCEQQITNCKQCYQINSQAYNCTKCNEFFILHNGICIQECSELNNLTFIYQQKDNTCVQCPQFCKICSQGVCQQCQSTKLLELRGTFVCVDNCLLNSFSNGQQCFPCPVQCYTCQSTINCTSCLPGYNLIEGQCTTQCPSHTFIENIYTGICVSCSKYLSKCQLCESTNTSQLNIKCYQCIYPYAPNSEGKCQSCQRGYFLQQLTLQCQMCDITCLNCSSTQNCQQCRQNLLLYNGECFGECPIGSFQNSNTCLSCGQSCNTCNLTNCLVCDEGYVLYNTSCLKQCPLGTVYSHGYCANCYPNCQNCSSPSYCQICRGNLFLFEGQCYDFCPEGYTYDSNKNCIPCKSGCTNCSSDLSTCYQCKNNLTNIGNGICILNVSNQICSSGQYQFQGNCYLCHSSCLTCSSGRSNKCLSCPSGSQLQRSGYCTKKCSSHQFYNSTTLNCQQCSQMCAQCIDNKDKCRSCYAPLVLSNTYTCENNCSLGYYFTSMLCLPCPQLCLNCTSATKCVQCEANVKFQYESLCYNQCPLSTYQNSSSSCSPCPIQCLNCSSSSNCSSCQYPYNLNYDNITQIGKCEVECPLATFSYHNMCIQCSQNCIRCNQSDCLQCITNKFLHLGFCFSICPVQTYPSPASGKCQSCPQQCETCTSLHHCTKCKNGFLKMQFSSYQIACVDQCPQQYEQSANQCIQTQCANCSICINSKCEECYQDFYLSEGQCFEDCIDNFYANQSTRTCENCINNCLLCINSTGCQLCIDGFNFTNETGCVQQAYLQFGSFSNMSGYTSNITSVTSLVYMSTSIGPIAFGQVANTYFNIQVCQFFYFHQNLSQDNKELKKFLNSLSSMSFSSGFGGIGQRRLLSQTSSQSFLQLNVPIFILMGIFLCIYGVVFIINKNIKNRCITCPKVSFYVFQISNYLRKRFKWIYFDFLMWISYIPFFYFGLIQAQKFNIDTFIQGISSILAVAILFVYSLYPLFIIYQIKKSYKLICLQNDAITQMSLSPWLSKVKRPRVLEEDQQFKYVTYGNLRLIYYPLKYLRKILFILVLVFSKVALNTLSILISLNVIFIVYMAYFRPRKVLYMILDFVIEFILLGFQTFLLVYITFNISDINIMSIITHVIGFITANLSIIIAIVFNLFAYYQIFKCLKGLSTHLSEKSKNKQKSNQFSSDKVSSIDISDQFIIQNKQSDLSYSQIKILDSREDDSSPTRKTRISNKNRINNKTILQEAEQPVQLTYQNPNNSTYFQQNSEPKMDIKPKRIRKRKQRKRKDDELRVENNHQKMDKQIIDDIQI